MQLTDFPIQVSISQYDESIRSMVARVAREPGVRAIYQIGGVSSPGISDIDLLVIFDDAARCESNLRTDLSDIDRYLFVHGLFGLTEKHFLQSFQYTFFHDFRLLWGHAYQVPEIGPERDGAAEINAQTALEYLLKLYITLSIELAYGITKVRNFLLLGKSISHDLDYLGITDGRLLDLREQLVAWRQGWFEEPPAKRELLRFIPAFYRELEAVLGNCLASTPIYIPPWVDLKVARNIEVTPGGNLSFTRKGVHLPSSFAWLGRRYFNLQHRLNKFFFSVPMIREGAPDEVSRRHEFLSAAKKYNADYFPHFITGGTGLDIFHRIGD